MSKGPAACCGSKSPAHKQIIRLMHRYNDRCYYCGVKCIMTCDVHNGALSPVHATRDHFTAYSAGGRSVDNLVLSCYRCNHHLDNATPDEREAYRLTLQLRRDRVSL